MVKGFEFRVRPSLFKVLGFKEWQRCATCDYHVLLVLPYFGLNEKKESFLKTACEREVIMNYSFSRCNHSYINTTANKVEN